MQILKVGELAHPTKRSGENRLFQCRVSISKIHFVESRCCKPTKINKDRIMANERGVLENFL